MPLLGERGLGGWFAPRWQLCAHIVVVLPLTVYSSCSDRESICWMAAGGTGMWAEARWRKHAGGSAHLLLSQFFASSAKKIAESHWDSESGKTEQE